jgi:hypothetical protein
VAQQQRDAASASLLQQPQQLQQQNEKQSSHYQQLAPSAGAPQQAAELAAHVQRPVQHDAQAQEGLPHEQLAQPTIQQQQQQREEEKPNATPRRPPQQQAEALGSPQPPQALPLAPATNTKAWQHVDTDISDEEDRAYVRYHKAEARRPCITGNRATHKAAAEAAAEAAEPAAGNGAGAAASRQRAWRPTWKALEAVQTTAGAPRRRGRQPKGDGKGGLGGGSGRSSDAAYQPMPLLPGEQPLGVEAYFGEGRAMLLDGTISAPPSNAGELHNQPSLRPVHVPCHHLRTSLSQVKLSGAVDHTQAAVMFEHMPSVASLQGRVTACRWLSVIVPPLTAPADC